MNVSETQRAYQDFPSALIKPRFSAAHKVRGKLCAYSYLLQDLVIGFTKFPSQIPLPSEVRFFFFTLPATVGGWVEI